MQQFFETFAKPQRELPLEQVIQEAKDTYRADLAAQLLQYHCESEDNLKILDNMMQGESTHVKTATEMFEYAYHGKLPKPDGSHAWLSLAKLILSARYGIEFFSPEVDGRSIHVPVNLEQVYLHAILRARLDLGTIPELDEDALPAPLTSGDSRYLNLKEVAVLAQMDEKSVRNATQPSVPDRLMTYKDGGRTLVEIQEALGWLKGRRFFIPTQVA